MKKEINIDILGSIGSDLKESIDDLIHQIRLIKQDIDNLQKYTKIYLGKHDQ